MIHNIIKILKKSEEFLLVLLLGLLVLFSFIQVLLRLFFSFGIPWADIFLRHLVLWIGFIGGAVAYEEGKHFAIDLLKKNFSHFILVISNILTHIFALLTLYYLFDSGMGFWKDEYIFKSTLFTIGSYEVPSYAFNCILPAGFFLLLIHISLKTVEDIFASFKSSP